MKRYAVFVVILLIIGTQTFADENLGDLENINFGWQLFNNKTEYMKLTVLGLNPLVFYNPLFFYNRNYSLSNTENFLQNSATQSEQKAYKNSQENDWFGFLLVAAGFSIVWTDAYKNPLKHRYFENIWQSQQQQQQQSGYPLLP